MKAKRIFTKPCPICGGAPTIRLSQVDPYGDRVYCTGARMVCSECGYFTTPSYVCDFETKNGMSLEDTTKEYWNRCVEEAVELLTEKYKN